MDDTVQNKSAWEYDAHTFWVNHEGAPSDLAARMTADPRAILKRHAVYLGEVKGKRLANLCGSCGKKAIPLALLGARVTVFDISEENRRYACETALAAAADINYVVGDIMAIDLEVFRGAFDILYMEGGILHYFHDLEGFMAIVRALAAPGGRLILSDFHPIHKVIDVNGIGGCPGDYFTTEILDAEMPHAKFYPEEIRKAFPTCRLRRYTLSEILNAVIRSGFTLRQFDEHPGWTNPKMPGEFTLVAEC